MVLAGSAPTPAHGADPIAHIHRGTTFIVLVDAAIVIYLLYTALLALGWVSGSLGSMFVGISVSRGCLSTLGIETGGNGPIGQQWSFSS